MDRLDRLDLRVTVASPAQTGLRVLQASTGAMVAMVSKDLPDRRAILARLGRRVIAETPAPLA